MFKPIDLHDTTSIVSTLDPAIDKDRAIDTVLEANDESRLNTFAAIFYRTPFAQLDPDQQREVAWESFQADFGEKCSKDPSAWREILPIKDGQSPTVFVIGVVMPDDINRIYDETRETATHRGRSDERSWRAFLTGLRGIQNWSRDVPERTVRGVKYVDSEWLKSTFVRGLRAVGRQVGSVILAWNDLTEEEVKN